MITILGGGISGLSTSYHLGHENCIIFEKKNYIGGHVYSYTKDGFTWDEGPHVSFTKHEYVKNLFQKSVNSEFLQFPVTITNYYHGSWIPHPAQSNLYAIPQPLRDQVLVDFLSSRNNAKTNPADFEEWLVMAFGKTFAENFPRAYTKKYWTDDPKNLTTDWVGDRVFYPAIDDVKNGYLGPLKRQTHYITEVRYPKAGGYLSFSYELTKGANIHLNKKVTLLSFREKKIHFSDGTIHDFDELISTIPLPELIEISDAPEDIKTTARSLNYSSLLLVNVVANHMSVQPYHWLYVYDLEKYSTRITCTESLSPLNGKPHQTGIQVEIYFSNSKQKLELDEVIAGKVCEELVEMGLIREKHNILNMHTRWAPWANVIFDHSRRKKQEMIFNWLEQFGLSREQDDLDPMTNWVSKADEQVKLGKLVLAGRFAQWKYFWSDDCVLRGKTIAEKK